MRNRLHKMSLTVVLIGLLAPTDSTLRAQGCILQVWTCERMYLNTCDFSVFHFQMDEGQPTSSPSTYTVGTCGGQEALCDNIYVSIIGLLAGTVSV